MEPLGGLDRRLKQCLAGCTVRGRCTANEPRGLLNLANAGRTIEPTADAQKTISGVV